ncbi:MAG: hypothetical protein FH748_03815 [Balneolaceae bacterium]|nr:hypothetical protein [Balneolaceae bacterium]
MRHVLFLSTALFIFISACSAVNNIDPYIDDKVEGPYTEIEGTVQYIDLEGGFWAIKDGQGKTYDPMNLPERFQQEGLKVYTKAKIRNDMASIHMAGPIIEIHTIKNLR